MKRIYLILSLLAGLAISSADCQGAIFGKGTASGSFAGSVNYDSYFTTERLRLDFVLGGDSSRQEAFLWNMYREPEWSGSHTNLVDTGCYGQYFLEMFSGEQLIYSRGFNTLFEEWRTTPQAENVPMSATQTVWTPFPKDKVHIVLYYRDHGTGVFVCLFESDLDPADRHIKPLTETSGKLTVVQEKGDNTHKCDLLFLPEGYTAAEMDKFRKDVDKFVNYFFTMEPYKSRRDDFNIRLVECASEDSGVTIPQHGIWKKTAMDSSFDTFYVDRYLTVLNHSNIADVAVAAPFDALIVVANETKYGGGGIYNSYALGTSDHYLSEQVMIHEFGHSFAGLGDEYFESETAYQDFYPASVEPWEPNVTTRVAFEEKWADMIEPGTPVPTPADSTRFGLIGVFEGGGYQAHGCWRPSFDCRMRNNSAPGFCAVCCRAIEAAIDYYVK